jgi:APA family basic amino acid/polyamine antiporter
LNKEKYMSNSQKPKLGFWSATSLVIGTVVGSGIFMLPASMAAYGGIGILGWAMSGLGALFLAMCFSRLSRKFPKIGGPYAYSRRAFGDLIGFQVASSYWVRGIVSLSAISIACSSYLSSLMPELLGDPLARSLVAMVMIMALTGVNLTGIKPVGVFQIVTSAVKIIPLVFMTFVGIFYINADHFTPFNVSNLGNMEALMAAAAVTFFSFMGLESATIPSDDVENPGKTIPRATIFGTSGVIILYLVSATAVLGVVPLDMLAQSKAPFSLAAERIVGPEWGGAVSLFITICAIVSCLGALNGYLLLQGKMPLAAAQDGLFPKIFARENKNGAPWFALITCAIVSCGLVYMTASPVVAEQFNQVCLIAAFLGLFVYAYSSVAEIVVMVAERENVGKGAFVKPTLIGIFAFTYCIWAMAGTGAQIGFMGVLFIFMTLPIYVWMCWRSLKTKSA